VDWKTQLTTEAGIPVGDNQNSVTAALRGPGLLSAQHLFIVPTMNPNLTPQRLRSASMDQVNPRSKRMERNNGRK
jgi:catalase